MSLPRHLSTFIAIFLLLLCVTRTSRAALVSGDTITPTFISGGWSLSLTLSPSSPPHDWKSCRGHISWHTIIFLAPGTATYTFDFFNDINGRSFFDMTAVFSSNPTSPPSIGSNFNVSSLDFGPGFHLGSVVPVIGTASINSVTNSSFSFSASSIVISSTPQTIRFELIATPEPSSGLLMVFLALCCSSSGDVRFSRFKNSFREACRIYPAHLRKTIFFDWNYPVFLSVTT